MGECEWGREWNGRECVEWASVSEVWGSGVWGCGWVSDGDVDG